MNETSLHLDARNLSDALNQFVAAWQQKLAHQGNVPTFFDHSLNEGLKVIYEHRDSIPWDEGFAATIDAAARFLPRPFVEDLLLQIVEHSLGRFVSFTDRMNAARFFSGNHPDQGLFGTEGRRGLLMSQGRFDCVKWKGIDLFKTVHDLAIYQMLMWELKPKSIIELGSGNGASAAWLADLARVNSAPCRVLSMDINPPLLEAENIEFVKGDCNDIANGLPAQKLAGLQRPWLVIEDAHVNVGAVIRYLHTFLLPGDYLIIEDSLEKRSIIASFLQEHPSDYDVDTLYCDYFGRNMTCAPDSILRRN